MKAIPVVLTAVLVSTTTPAVAAVSPDYPLVMDVDVTQRCGQPSTGRLTIFNPSNAQVEWRLRHNGKAITGTTVNGSAELTLPGPGEFLVDAREPGRAYGKVWRDKASNGCDPVRVVSVGDSVVWNQGVDQHQKFPRLTAELLGDATGRGFAHRDYSISGAVLDAPDLPCPGRITQDPDGDGEMELGEVTTQMPDVFCQLETAAQNSHSGQETDLVIINGCINDMDPLLGVPLGITPGNEGVATAVRRECGGVGAAPFNPAKDVPYFSGAKVGYGGRGMKAAIEKAHSLPGRPKVLVVDFYYALSRASFVPRGSAPRAASTPPTNSCACRTSAARRAVRAVHPRVGRGVPAGGGRGERRLGRRPVRGRGRWPVHAGQRRVRPEPQGLAAAARGPAVLVPTGGLPRYSATALQCLTAAIAHPDTVGSRQYAENFLRNQQLRQWFGLGGNLARSRSPRTAARSR